MKMLLASWRNIIFYLENTFVWQFFSFLFLNFFHCMMNNFWQKIRSSKQLGKLIYIYPRKSSHNMKHYLNVILPFNQKTFPAAVVSISKTTVEFWIALDDPPEGLDSWIFLTFMSSAFWSKATFWCMPPWGDPEVLFWRGWTTIPVGLLKKGPNFILWDVPETFSRSLGSNSASIFTGFFGTFTLPLTLPTCGWKEKLATDVDSTSMQSINDEDTIVTLWSKKNMGSIIMINNKK